ncbi:hypothetical protein PSE_4183 [Pseudovibrio sp. FO-BEG1]|uniref:hypothetical protein n=1 Tax=Pseudovibrio sp. (strain FO-BEG1) TaxID=911045 RepID=UPI000238D215|nr:hypothetical protein [Pseudovibrio sp. FO-BEG1]AEV38687.1 hypothetical protein PSE_4183 [Pseudovibrio sp. FO-BEG1]
MMQSKLNWQHVGETWEARTESGLVYTIREVSGGYLVAGAENGTVFTNITKPNPTLEEAKARCEEGFRQEQRVCNQN